MTLDKATLSPVSKLGELLDLVIDYRGKTPKKLGGDFTNSGIPVISAIHIKRGKIVWEERERFVTKDMFQKWMKDPLKKGDVLLTSEAPLGEVALVPNDEDLVLSQRLFALRTKSELLDSRYLMYFFQSNIGQEELKGRSSGSTVVGIRQAELVNISVPCPPIANQRVVGEVLATIDAKISANEALSKTLEDIAQTIFKSWFIDFDPVKAKMVGEKPAGMDVATAALFPDSMEESELGLIPRGWEFRPIGGELEVSGGTTPSTTKPEFWDGEHCWTTPKDLSKQSGLITTSSERRITEAGLNQISSGLLPIHSVLMSCRAPIGYVSITAIPTAVNQGFITLRNSAKYSPLYLVNWLLANMQEIKNRAGGATFAEISRKSFREIPFLVPSIEVLAKFSELTVPIVLQFQQLALQNEKLVAARDSLLPRLISGELQIPKEMLAS